MKMDSFKICDRGNSMEIIDRATGVGIAEYAYYRAPNGHEENHQAAIRRMRAALRNHINNGGTIGNYQF